MTPWFVQSALSLLVLSAVFGLGGARVIPYAGDTIGFQVRFEESYAIYHGVLLHLIVGESDWTIRWSILLSSFPLEISVPFFRPPSLSPALIITIILILI